MSHTVASVDYVRLLAKARLQRITDWREARKEQYAREYAERLSEPTGFLWWRKQELVTKEQIRCEFDEDRFDKREASFLSEYVVTQMLYNQLSIRSETENRLIALLRLCDGSVDGLIQLSSEDADALGTPVTTPVASVVLEREAAIRELNVSYEESDQAVLN